MIHRILLLSMLLLPLLLLFWCQARPLWKRNLKKEAVVYSLLLGTGGLLGILLCLQVEIPSPTLPLMQWFEPLGDKVYGVTERE